MNDHAPKKTEGQKAEGLTQEELIAVASMVEQARAKLAEAEDNYNILRKQLLEEIRNVAMPVWSSMSGEHQQFVLQNSPYPIEFE